MVTTRGASSPAGDGLSAEDGALCPPSGAEDDEDVDDGEDVDEHPASKHAASDRDKSLVNGFWFINDSPFLFNRNLFFGSKL